MLVCVSVLSQFSWERDQPRARRTTRCSISSYPPDNDSSRVPVCHVPLFSNRSPMFSNRSPKTTLQRPSLIFGVSRSPKTDLQRPPLHFAVSRSNDHSPKTHSPFSGPSFPRTSLLTILSSFRTPAFHSLSDLHPHGRSLLSTQTYLSEHVPSPSPRPLTSTHVF